jgi:hypothetical protein
MAHIELREEMLVVTLEGIHKLLALKSKLEVPIASIAQVTPRPVVPTFNDPDFRGTYVPGVVMAGMTVRGGDGVYFCDFEDPERAIEIDLIPGAPVRHIIVELSDMSPEEAARGIEAARLARLAALRTS